MFFPRDVPTLSDGDLTLRAHRLEDVPAIVAQCTDPEMVRWTTVPLGYDEQVGRDWVTKEVRDGWESGRAPAFALECPHPDGVRRFAGTVSLVARGDGHWEVGFGTHPAVRGQGVTTRAVALALDWVFAERGARTVSWSAHRGNLASRRIAWRLGFTILDGVLPGWLGQRGELRDAWLGTLRAGDPREPRTPWYDAVRREGDVVRLRSLHADDVPRIVEACRDAESLRWLPMLPDPYTEADAHAYVASCAESMAAGSGVFWAVADPVDDRLVGSIAVPRLHRHWAEIGYWTHPGERGRGVMTEAVRLVTDVVLGSEDDGLGRAMACIKVAVGNDASRRVAEAAGFAEVGRERRAELLRDGRLVDLLVLDRLAPLA